MLTRAIGDDEVAAYRADGVVHLRGLLDADWVARALHAFETTMARGPEGLNHLDLGEMAESVSAAGMRLLTAAAETPSGRFWVRTFNWSRIAELEALATVATLPEVAARLMGAARINFYGDQLFLKEPGSLHRTAFHQDAPYFHLEGNQCCTIWMPFDVIDRDNGAMGYVRGSHRWNLHQPNIFVSQEPIPGSTGERLPDIEGGEAAFDVAYYDARPGDAIVHHVRTVHGSTGNRSADRTRRALALRYVGDDVRYLERTGSPPDSQKSASLRDGDRMDSAEFPLVWEAATGYLRAPAGAS